MQRLKPTGLFPYLLAIWTALFLVFTVVVKLGGAATVEEAGGHPIEPSYLVQMYKIGPAGLLAIWFMGAAILFILRRWMRAVAKGPGTPYDVKIQNDGKTIESSQNSEKF